MYENNCEKQRLKLEDSHHMITDVRVAKGGRCYWR